MSPLHCKSTLILGINLAATLTLFPLPVQAANEKWAVPAAEIRFRVEMEQKPSDPEAGVVAIFQNGGLLPQPAADSVVLDSAGKELKSECIWNNTHEGYGIVFETPTAPGEITIYLKPASQVRAWTPQSPLHPGLLLYTANNKTSINEARGIANQKPAGNTARMGLVPMVADRANRFGVSDSYASYYCGWLKVPVDGPLYYATISSDGSEATLDGKTVADWPGKHTYEANDGKMGQKGKTMVMGKGPHRFEYFHFAANNNKPQAQFVWRMPDAPKDHPFTTPANNDWMHSGSVQLLGAESRSGIPVALFEKKAESYLGLEGAWIDLFTLSVPMAENMKNVEISWVIDGKYKLSGNSVLWPSIRGDLPKVQLTLKTMSGLSASSRILYPDEVPPRAKLSNQADREMWQQAMCNRAKASPHRKHEADDWTKPFWALLPEIIEPGEGRDVLAELFNNSADELGNLTPEARSKLEDIYIDEIVGDKAVAEAFLKTIIDEQKDPARKFHWQLKQIDFYLFETGDTKTARRLAEKLQTPLSSTSLNDAVLRLVQYGDIERTEGNSDRATQLYAAAQQEYQRRTHPTGTPKPTPKPVANGMVIEAAKGTQTDWRVRTVRQNAYFSQVSSLLDQKNYFVEARTALNQWQIEFPFSKFNGDYALAEGRYYSAAGNFNRALRVLRTYRKQTEISNELPPVMEQELRCLVALGRKDELKELVGDITKRFPDLPLVKSAQEALENAEHPEMEKRTKQKRQF